MIISGFRSMVFLFTQPMVFPLTETMGKVLAFYKGEIILFAPALISLFLLSSSDTRLIIFKFGFNSLAVIVM